ncbi:MAG: S41 family peptidase [Pseudomonadota bacterium]
MDLFGEVFEKVHANYVTEVEDAELVEGAINGMLSTLDPHSSYLTRDSFDDVREQTTGEFGGLGIEVTMEDGLVKVVAPIDDTPAAKAGVQAGDLIVTLDEEPVLGMNLSDAVEIMRGAPGSDITIGVLREGKSEPFDIVITRAVITVKSVRSRIEDDNIGYIRVTTFSEQTEKGLKAALKDLRKELGDDMIGIVLDLRNNPGGLLDQAVAVSDVFLEFGEIVSTKGRNNRDSQRYNARRGDASRDVPIVVLVNGGSASASEIVAGALQDNKRAVVLGTRSFGKGSVQTILPLRGGADGALRLTTARYYTPSGRSIQSTGIEPDIIVELPSLTTDEDTKEEGEEEDAPRRPTEGTLPNALDAEGEKPIEGDESVAAASDDEKEGDYQLQRASELLKSAWPSPVAMVDAVRTENAEKAAAAEPETADGEGADSTTAEPKSE